MEIIIEEGGRDDGVPSAKLTIDMSTYCKLCIIDRHNEQDKHLEQKDEKIISPKIIHEREEVDLKVREERADFIDNVSELFSALPWKKVKEVLCAQYNMTDPLERKLSNALSAMVDPPLVVSTLDNRFLEFVKNSMDAIIKRSWVMQDSETKLMMTIKASLNNDHISIVIADNAGGFPAEYLNYFVKSLKNGSYKNEERLSDKRGDFKYLFGGQGKGLPCICKNLLDGDLEDSTGRLSPYYYLLPGTNSIRVENNNDGAQITLTSLIAPCKEYVHDVAASLDRSLTLSPPPLLSFRLAKRHKEKAFGSSSSSTPSTPRPSPVFFAPEPDHLSTPELKFKPS